MPKYIEVPCYISENTVKTFMNKDFKIPNALRELVFRDKGTLQLIASFMKNPNAPNTFGVPSPKPITCQHITSSVA